MRTCTRHYTSRDTKYEAKWGRERGPYGWTRSGSTSRPFFYKHKLQKNARTTIFKNNGKMETEPDCLLSFSNHTCAFCGCVLRRRGTKQKETQNKVSYRHTKRSQRRVRSSPKHNSQPDIRGGDATRVRRERERGGTRGSASNLRLYRRYYPRLLCHIKPALSHLLVNVSHRGGFYFLSLYL